MKRSASLTLLATLLLLSADVAGATTEEETFERTVSVSPDGRVTLRNTNGHILVRAWNGGDVRISALKKVRARGGADARDILDDIRIEISEDGGDVTIETELPRMKGWFGGTSASVAYELEVPSTVRLDLRSTNGKIEVEGVAGDVELSTTNGGIHAEDLGGRLTAETTNGRIEARNVAGPLDAETTNGSIRAEVTADALSEDMSLETTNGSVDLRLSPGVGARIDARAGNGSVSTDLPFHGEAKRHSISGDINGGGSTIRIRTSNGSIQVREL